ncbi:MAG: nitroreductase family protein [Candidatus Heimdallarchaeaceae archaeon]
MQLNQSIVEIITKRKSVRTYDATKDVEKSKIQIIEEAMVGERTEGFRFAIVTFNELKSRKERLGTYGFIKGANLFMVGIISEDYSDRKNLSISFGRTFERIILKATDLGLGTCWMVSTFNRKQLSQKIGLGDHENIAIVSPLGYSALKKRPVERIMRQIPKSDQRKTWGELFFHNDFKTPLSREDTGKYSTALEMLRLSPSAANTQPWRIIKRDNSFDLYVSKDERGRRHVIDCNFNDAGIAMCHFELSTRELDLPGEWLVDGSATNLKKFGLEYVYSWKL